ncbi:hypothetical protein [Streptomyces sp. NPDC102282]
MKEPGDEAEGGRGLFLLSCLTDELQTQPLLRGKICFRISSPAGEEGGQ